MGEEVGEDVALCDAQPGLRLAAEDALVHPLTPVVNDVVVKEVKRVIVKFTLELPDGPLGYSPQGGDSSRSDTIFQSVKNGQFFESRQWLAVGSPWPHFTKFFQFFRYRRSFLSWGDSAPGSS